MGGELDFERVWLEKFKRCLEKNAGAEMREEIMRGSEGLSQDSAREEVMKWTQSSMERLDSLLDVRKRRDVMLGCACHYPHADLEDLKKMYEETYDIDVVHRMLQERFASFLKKTLNLPDKAIEDITRRGWGVAGMIKGETVLAIKIPKSSNLLEYMGEDDPQKKRVLYCHCPRIRDAIRTGMKISPTYCFCGAGFYKDIWEFITGAPVSVEVLESVLAGGEVCRFAIHLRRTSSFELGKTSDLP